MADVSRTRVILHEANVRQAFDSMRWMENVDQKFGHLFGQLPRPDYVGSHPDSKPLDVQDRSWMIEIKSRDADPHNKLLDFVEDGRLSFRDFVSLQLVGHFKTVLRRANRQLQSGRDILNPHAKGALIYINRGFQSLRREAAASIIFGILRSPDSRLRAIDLVVYIQEGFDGDPDPEHRPIELFKIWARDPSDWDAQSPTSSLTSCSDRSSRSQGSRRRGRVPSGSCATAESFSSRTKSWRTFSRSPAARRVEAESGCGRHRWVATGLLPACGSIRIDLGWWPESRDAVAGVEASPFGSCMLLQGRRCKPVISTLLALSQAEGRDWSRLEVKPWAATALIRLVGGAGEAWLDLLQRRKSSGVARRRCSGRARLGRSGLHGRASRTSARCPGDATSGASWH